MTCIEAYKEELIWAVDKQLQLIINIPYLSEWNPGRLFPINDFNPAFI